MLEAIEAVASGVTTRADSAMTPSFADFAADWTSKRLHQKFPDHVREKDESEDVQQLRDYINPHLGHFRLPDVQLKDAEPIPREWVPRIPKSANKAKTSLFPDEDAKLASCPAVLLERRIA